MKYTFEELKADTFELFDKHLSEKDSASAKENFLADYSGDEENMFNRVVNIHDALISGFNWSKTPEEHNYWQKIYENF